MSERLQHQQALFYADIRAGSLSPALLDCFGGGADDVAHRLAIYRRSIMGNLSHALFASYPVVAKIVGDDFFRAAARDYIQQHPSQSGDLNEYGGDFAPFLAGWAPAAELPYLPDVARLEWLVQEAHNAADTHTDLSALAQCDPADYPQLRCEAHAALRRLDSAWPLDAIWQVNAAGYAGDMRVDFSRASRLAIVRRGALVEIDALQAAQASFIDALLGGDTLGAALALALGQDPGFDLTACLTYCIRQGYIGRLYLPPNIQETP